MEVLEEKRKILQIPIYDEDGRIKFYAIPNYTLRKEFETHAERDFHRLLIKVVQRINEENKTNNNFIQISTQVAVNRILNINNERNKVLYDEIKDKSIDYVIFDLNSGKIICCFELNGKEHSTNIKRAERDILLEKMFKNVVKLIYIENNNYNENYIYSEITENL